jgi:RNA polymerase-binding transcription factor DksA
MVAATERDLLRKTLEYRADGTSHRTMRREIREALERLSSGTYGFCEGCCLTIPWAQLLQIPERRRCARCEPTLEGAVG